MISRNTPLPITPHNGKERRCEGLREYSSPPLTYKKYQQQPDGTVVFVGVFLTPKVTYSFGNGKVHLSSNKQQGINKGVTV